MKNLLYICLIFGSFSQLFGQKSIPIEDPNFRAALCTKYPTIFDAACVLMDTTKADKIEGTMNLSYHTISIAAEITQFNRVDSIILSHNKLTKFLKYFILTFTLLLLKPCKSFAKSHRNLVPHRVHCRVLVQHRKSPFRWVVQHRAWWWPRSKHSWGWLERDRWDQCNRFQVRVRPM